MNLSNNRRILIGELHGAKENTEFYKKIAEFYIKKLLQIPCIFLELDKKFEKGINKFLKDKANLPFFRINNLKKLKKDVYGKFCLEHLKFLKWYKNISKGEGYIVCYDRKKA